MNFLKRSQLQNLLQIFLFLSCLLPVFAADGDVSNPSEFPLAARIVLAIFMIPIGLAYCFAGFKIIKFLIFVAGFFLGGILAFVIARLVTHDFAETSKGALIGIYVGVAIVALIGGFTALCCFKLGIVILGGFVGYAFAAAIISTGVPSSDVDRIILTIALVVVGGVLALILSDILIIVSTAFSGSSLFLQGIDLFANTGFKDYTFNFANRNQLSQIKGSLWAMFASFIIMGLLGVVVQFRLKRKYD